MTLLKSSRFLTFGLALVLTGFGAESAHAYDVWSQSIIGVVNRDYGGQMGFLDFQHTGDSSFIQTSTNTSFTGLDGNNVQQTMNFTAINQAQSNFGQLHLYAGGSVTNSYYNAANPYFYNSNTNDFNPMGTPDTMCSLGFAGFNDTLHFGGALQAGYKARYLFHVDGTNSGYGVMADIAGHDESFFAVDPGFIDTVWATQAYDINGIDPQEIHVQFSNQFVVDTYNVADGSNLVGYSDFSSTLTLAGIEVLDANGNQVTGWTLESESGTVYNGIGSVPEPGSMLVIAVGAIGFLARKRRQSH